MCSKLISSKMTKNIAVIGAGVIGLSTSYRILKDMKKCRVTIFSKNFSPDTTGDISAGFIYPYLCGESKDVERWLQMTVQYLTELHTLPNALEIGIQPCFGYILGEEDIPLSLVKSLPFVEPVSEKEVSDIFHRKTTGLKLTTWTCHCQKYLPWLTKKIEDLGADFVQRDIKNFEELEDFDLIVNCSGMGAFDLTDDTKLVPVRGQVTVVKAPWIKHFVLQGYNYVLPRLDDVVLGGTSQKGNFNTAIDPIDKENIWQDCCKLNPSVKYSEVVEHRSGLRPSRDPIRLEIEEKRMNGKMVPILHNYGHGGAGVTLHWGCAVEASALLQEYLKKTNSRL